MAYIYAVPPWFCGYDALVEVIFAVMTLLVGVYSYKIYKLTAHRASHLFSLGFFSIAISYIILALYNFLLLTEMNQKICAIANISNVTLFTNSQMYLHLFFYLIGLMILLYITLKVPCKRVFSLLGLLVFISFVFTLHNPFGAYILSTVLLAYIFWYYMNNYLSRPILSKQLVMIGFGMLLGANILFIFSFDYGAYYIIAHIIKFIAYSIILINLIVLLRRK